MIPAWRNNESPSDGDAPKTEPEAPTAQEPSVPRHRRAWYVRLPVLLLETLAAVAALGLLLVGILGVWIAARPVQFDWLTPYVVAALNETVTPLHVTVAGTSLRWNPGHPSFELVADRASLVDASGAHILTLPSVAVSLSVEALLEGELRPVRLTLVRPRLRIDRAADGSIGISGNVTQDAGTAPVYVQPSEPLSQLVRSLVLAPRASDPLGRLLNVSIEHGDIELDDAATGQTWRLADGTATLARSATAIDAGISGNFSVGAARWSGHVTSHLDTRARDARFALHLDGLVPTLLAPVLPGQVAALSKLDVPLSLDVGGGLDLNSLQLRFLKASLDGRAGRLVSPSFTGGHLAFDRLGIAVAYDAAKRQLVLEHAVLDLGQTRVQLRANASPLAPDVLLGTPPMAAVAVTAAVTVHDVPLDGFNEIWPPSVATDARSWIVANLTRGTLTELSAEIGGEVPPGPVPTLTHETLAGKFAIAGATVDYLDGLPKLQAVDGDVSFTGKQMALSVTRGKLLRLTESDGKILIDGLDQPHQHMTIDMGITGPMSDVLQVLNAKRLQYASAVGLIPAEVEGELDGTLHFGFELEKELPLDEVDYGAKAKLTGIGIRHVALGQDLDHGDFNLLLDRTHVRLDGTGNLGQLPAKLRWAERITGHDGPMSEIHAVARMDQAARQRFSVDVIPDIVQGPVDVELNYSAADEHRSTAALRLDLADATMAVDMADWIKPAGVAGHADLTLQIQDDHIRAIDGLHATAPGLDLTAGLTLDDGQILHATIDHGRINASEVRGSVDHPAGNPWHIVLAGPEIDLTPIRKALAKDTEPPTDEGPNLLLDLHADRMVIGEGRSMRAASVHAAVAHHAMTSGTVNAGIGDKGILDMTLDPVSAGGSFTLSTDDFGSFFKLAGITEDVVGGTFEVHGTARQDGDFRRFSGHAEGKDYRLVHMPFVARLGSVMSLQALSSLLAGNGIPFTALKADFVFERNRLELHHGRAYGGAFGINAEGWFDTKAGTLGLQGTVVPAYTLNSALGGVPILGNLILGGEGQGLFGANVGIYGKLAEPTISVNALSALAPGFLRNLFLFDAPGGGQDKSPR
jgi:hypothetical protein